MGSVKRRKGGGKGRRFDTLAGERGQKSGGYNCFKITHVLHFLRFTPEVFTYGIYVAIRLLYPYWILFFFLHVFSPDYVDHTLHYKPSLWLFFFFFWLLVKDFSAKTRIKMYLVGESETFSVPNQPPFPNPPRCQAMYISPGSVFHKACKKGFTFITTRGPTFKVRESVRLGLSEF